MTPTDAAPLSALDRDSSAPRTGELASALADCETVIERGLNTFVEVGTSLLRIRDERLYRQDYRDFDSYCQNRWSFGRRRADQLIAAAEIGTIVPVSTESQARELVGLEPEIAAQVMDLAADSGEKVTARGIREAREQLTEPPKSDADAAREADELEASVHDDEPALTNEECRALADPGDLSDDEPDYTPEPAPEKPRRAALPDAFWRATYDLEKKVTTLKNLAKDDRAQKNADQIREQSLSYLIRARDELQLVIDQFTN